MNIQLFSSFLDLTLALLWQYNEATNIQGLINAKNEWYTTNQTDFWDAWEVNVFNLEQANEFGLAVWSIILNQPLSIGLPPDVDKPIWGFGPFTNNNVNFNRGNFSIGGDPLLVLTMEEQRLILQLRYFQLVTRGAVTEVNAFLKYAFQFAYGVGNFVYMLDNYNMSIDYVFTFLVPRRLITILQFFNLLPGPSGVGVGYIVLPAPRWGFGPYTGPNANVNFNRGGFAGSYV